MADSGKDHFGGAEPPEAEKLAEYRRLFAEYEEEQKRLDAMDARVIEIEKVLRDLGLM
jgi:hypothetical protein